MMEKDDRLIKNIRKVLDQSLDELDAATQSRLTQARHLALERRQNKRKPWLYWVPVPAAGLLLLLLLLNWPMVQQPSFTGPDPADIEILTATEPLEFYQEEIEFYEWLSEVLEAENELSGYSAPQPGTAVAERFVGAGGPPSSSAERRVARLSGVI